ncbi:MAG: ATP phosphoribosyltransferase [Planctomycetes bacterium]|nr:ATP phosphoribosyltransferase [Planctomycetota bacterium]
MTPPTTGPGLPLELALPKGRMQDGVLALLAEAGLPVRVGGRDYRPRLHVPGIEAKLLKPQNIVEMLHAGTRHVGFAGWDWVVEKGFEDAIEDLCDTRLDPVRIVAAAPADLLVDGRLPADRPLVVASEYERLARRWIETEGLEATFVRSYGATEVFPPEDADVIVDNTATGDTLRANGLVIVAELMRSSTRLIASRRARAVPALRRRIDDLLMLVRSVLDARGRVMLELNCTAADLPRIVEVLPCMRTPTVSTLHAGAGHAVKAAVPREALAELIPALKATGATDLVVTPIVQLVP